MKKFYIIALILVFGSIFTGMIIGTNNLDGLLFFVDPPSFLILFLPVILLLKSQFSWKEIGSAFAIGFKKNGVSETELKKALLFFKALQKYSICAGIIGLMTGGIFIFNYVSDSIALSRSFAVALLVVFYAVILNFTVALPFQFGLKKRIIEAGE